MIHSKFLSAPKPSAGMPTPKLSQDETPGSHPVISPELFRFFFILINQNVAAADIAWRKATYPKEPEIAKIAKDDASSNDYNKSKLTGSPAFKELKNLIITILLSNGMRAKSQ